MNNCQSVVQGVDLSFGEFFGVLYCKYCVVFFCVIVMIRIQDYQLDMLREKLYYLLVFKFVNKILYFIIICVFNVVSEFVFVLFISDCMGFLVVVRLFNDFFENFCCGCCFIGCQVEFISDVLWMVVGFLVLQFIVLCSMFNYVFIIVVFQDGVGCFIGGYMCCLDFVRMVQDSVVGVYIGFLYVCNYFIDVSIGLLIFCVNIKIIYEENMVNNCK